jgi:hypothetical protein
LCEQSKAALLRCNDFYTLHTYLVGTRKYLIGLDKNTEHSLLTDSKTKIDFVLSHRILENFQKHPDPLSGKNVDINVDSSVTSGVVDRDGVGSPEILEL